MIDILAVAFIIYQLLQIVRGTRAAHILVGILAVVVTYEIALRTGLEALRTLLASLAPYTAIAIIVLFQSEIRRTLARLGRKRLFGGYRSPESTAEILLALSSLSRDRTGALIILERDIGLRTFIESGVRLDSQISRDLLLSIFLPGTALHDGAVIVQKDRICRGRLLSSAKRESGVFHENRHAASRRHRHHRRDRLPLDHRERRNGPDFGGGIRRDRERPDHRAGRRAYPRHFGVAAQSTQSGWPDRAALR